MNTNSWTTLRNQCPVDFMTNGFEADAYSLESELQEISKEQYDDYELMLADLLEYKRKTDNMMTEILTYLNQVYKEAQQYDDAAEGVYRLIDMNLRFYRYTKIDVKIEEANQGGTTSLINVIEVKQSLQMLIDIIAESIEQANQEFEPSEDEEDKVVYLATLAKQIEYKIRYFAKYMTKQDEDGEVIDYYEVLENSQGKEILDEAQQQQMNENVQQAENSLSEEADDILAG